MMRKIAAAVGIAVVGAVLALVAPSAAQAAPVARPTFTGNTFTVTAIPHPDGSVDAILPEAWNVGDCQQLEGGKVTLTPTDASHAFVAWTGWTHTFKTSNRDIWFEDAKWFTANGSQVAVTIGQMHSPDMQVGPFYQVNGFANANSATSLLTLVRTVQLHADC